MCRFYSLIIQKTHYFSLKTKKLPMYVTGKSENVSADHWILLELLAETAARQQPET